MQLTPSPPLPRMREGAVMPRNIPIIFSALMVRALMDGRKTMSRRLAWRIPRLSPDFPGKPSPWQKITSGDRLWVRETWCEPHNRECVYRADLNASEIASEAEVMKLTQAQRGPAFRPWRSPIHMPRWASRLTLVITAAKIEPLQDISKEDVIAEGITERDGYPLTDVHAGWHEPFADLWTSLHGPDSWNDNPEVVALTFTVHKQNIADIPPPDSQ